jgi:tRNA(Arg) A34 adenosine deaminase TadA
MAHNPAWHAEYLALENAEATARAAYRAARGAKKVAALEVLRATGKARWDFEMAACRIINVGLDGLI